MSSVPVEAMSFEDEYKSTVDQLLQSCPKFRILVLGRSGVGKSHLINAVFGTEHEHTVVEHGRRAGVSDIEQEITSENNPRLILHDSQGFSHGDAGNFEIVQKFIEKRSKMPDLKDQLHAIWLCTEVPTYGGSLLEVGDEKILQLNNKPVPIVAVFTKYDILLNSFSMQATNDDLYGDIEEDTDSIGDNKEYDTVSTTGVSIDASTRSLANEKLREMIQPYEAALEVPWVAVSVRPDFNDTLDELAKATKARIDTSVGLIWAITQQPSVDLKIEASIDVGKQKYWKGLSTGLALPGWSLAKWLKVVHRDIVKVWGLRDPDMVLSFSTKVISELQEDLVEEDSGAAWNVSVGAVTGTAALVSGIIPPAATVAIPVAVSIVFAAWVYNAARVTPNVLRGMMGYIVDLTIVMQSLSLLMQGRNQVTGSASPVNKRLFDLALRAYRNDIHHSPQKVHEEIRSFATLRRAIFGFGEVIKEVERLIQDHRFKPSEIFMAAARENAPSGN